MEPSAARSSPVTNQMPFDGSGHGTSTRAAPPPGTDASTDTSGPLPAKSRRCRTPFAAIGTRAAFASTSTGRSSSPREMWSGLRVSTSRRSAPACVVRVRAVKTPFVIGRVPFSPFGQ